MITESMHAYQQMNTPVCNWDSIDTIKAVKHQISNMTIIKQLMSTDVLTVYPDDPIALVKIL